MIETTTKWGGAAYVDVEPMAVEAVDSVTTTSTDYLQTDPWVNTPKAGYYQGHGKFQKITIHLVDEIDTGDYNTQINCSSNHPLPVINALIDRLEELRETFKSQL